LGSIGLVFGCMSCWVRNLHWWYFRLWWTLGHCNSRRSCSGTFLVFKFFKLLPYLTKNSFIDRIDVVWFIDWVTKTIILWSINRFWLIDWLINWCIIIFLIVDWLIDWFIYWIDKLIFWLIFWLIDFVSKFKNFKNWKMFSLCMNSFKMKKIIIT